MPQSISMAHSMLMCTGRRDQSAQLDSSSRPDINLCAQELTAYMGPGVGIDESD